MTVLLNEHGEKQYKVLVAVPSGDLVHARFAQCKSLMMAYTQFMRPEMDVRDGAVRGTYLVRARADLVRSAYEHQATHILWLDADMKFPKDALIRLLMRDKPIIGANYATRIPPILPTATCLDGQPLWEGDDLTEVQSAGFGCLLTSMEVFAALDKPYFALGYSPKDDDYSGEDVFFFQKARKAGFSVWIDNALSEEVGHLGEFEYLMAHARMTREAAKQHGAD